VVAPTAGECKRLRRAVVSRLRRGPHHRHAHDRHSPGRSPLTSPGRSPHPGEARPPLPSEARTPKAHLSRAKPAPGRSPFPSAARSRYAPPARRSRLRPPQPTKVTCHRHVSLLQASCVWAAHKRKKPRSFLRGFCRFFGCAGLQLDFPAQQFFDVSGVWLPFEETIVVGWV
jgi:hypothetical protein